MTPEKNWLRGPKKSPMTQKNDHFLVYFPDWTNGPYSPGLGQWSQWALFTRFGGMIVIYDAIPIDDLGSLSAAVVVQYDDFH